MNRFIFEQTTFENLKVIYPKPIADERGYFERYFCQKDFQKIGFNIAQINHSFTLQKGTIRGMHYQAKPHCEAKIIRCIKGEIYDVALDLRAESPTFLKYFALNLSQKNAKYLYIPKGFAHGFQTLTQECEIIYLVSEFYTPSADCSLNPIDPAFNIKWPLKISNISPKDKNAIFINESFKGI